MFPGLVAAALVLAAAGALFAADGLDPAQILKPLGDSWPTYSGDYTGRRYSALTEINQSNVKRLTLAWASRLVAGPGPAVPLPPPAFGPRPSPDDRRRRRRQRLRRRHGRQGRRAHGERRALRHAPDNVWALDAQDGRELWHFYWRTRGGTHIGNRGAAMWGNYLFFVTPDDYLISLDARTGQERWHKEIAPFSQQYFLTSAPIVVGNHVIVGTGNDLDSPGYLQSFDPETGEQQWKLYAVPMNPGDPGLETWKNLDAARNGGGHPWLPGVYDPETQPLHLRHRQPDAGLHVSSARGEGDNLFTCAIVAVNVDTGKMAWYFQTSPHDTHDWDSAQTPILVDGDDQRQAAQAGGDREPQRLLLHARSAHRRAAGHEQVLRHRELGRRAQRQGAAGAHSGQGPSRRPARSCRRTTAAPPTGRRRRSAPTPGLLYVPSAETYAMYYLTETDPRGAMGLGGKDEVGVGTIGSYITRDRLQDRPTVWRHRFQTARQRRPGARAAGDGGQAALRRRRVGQLLRDRSGERLDRCGTRASARCRTRRRPTWSDGRQHVLVAAGDTLYSFALYQ